jgi:hypothetical protein
MRAIRFSESIDIKGKPELIFDYTQNYNTRLQWDSFLVQAYLLDNATQAAKGAKAWCVSKNGMGMETQYVSFNRPKVTAVIMTKGPYMFKKFAASWNFKEETGSVTKVIFVYSFSLRFPFNLVSWLIKWNLKTNVKQRLIDLRRTFLESMLPDER